MSTINAVRIINLNYNNNAIRVVDEIFQLGGESTLLCLRNGGGKSVLVQMMTAPFVHKQYRKTKDRPFESYFTSAKPTFILVEWKLDGDAGYCLTGMMVRRSQVSEEEGQEPLEMINFIGEYTCRCEHDLYHIPLVERSKNEVILKNFTVCRQIFEGDKKDTTKKFFYYDMNHYAQSKQYFDKLREYKIYDKEWETIIRKVNVKESGLSELFSDCKNEKELIEKWFLEAIESKLNKEQNRMKEFQTIMEKYIRMYKNNRSKIERRDTILQFKEDMWSVEERACHYQTGEIELEQAKIRIVCFRQELSLVEKKLACHLEKLIQQGQEWEERIARIEYEKKSLEIHHLMNRLRFHSSNRDMIGLEKDALEEELYRLLRREIYGEDYYQKPLESMLSVTGQAKMVLAQLDTTLKAYDSQMEKLAVDIRLVEREKQKIEDLLGDYIQEVHRNMAKIDGNSTITIRNKEIKILRLQLPDWEENEGLYHQRLDDYLEELTRNGVKIYEANENAINYLSSRITTKYLYDAVVGIGNIQIKLYKIEEQREYPITWAEVARNSGGEGFLSAFVILSSLLQYMRRDEYFCRSKGRKGFGNG